MKYIPILLLLNFSILNAQDIQRIDTDDLIEILNKEDDSLYIINFWATWCGPCVTELPHFQKVSRKYDQKKISWLLVSLDFPSQVESRLLPFLNEKNIDLPVVLMEDLDYNKWISRVDEKWKGNLPATLFYNKAVNKREFYAGALEEDELTSIIERNLN